MPCVGFCGSDDESVRLDKLSMGLERASRGLRVRAYVILDSFVTRDPLDSYAKGGLFSKMMEHLGCNVRRN